MNITALLIKLKQLEIRICAKGERLEIEDPGENLTKVLVQQIKVCKPQILERLRTEIKSNQLGSVTHIEEQDYYDVSHSQRRFWVIDHLQESNAINNISSAYRITGLHVKHFHKTVSTVVDRHESLRTYIINFDGSPKQRIRTLIPENLIIDTTDLIDHPGGVELAEKIANEESRKPFDLSTGPLLRIHVVKLDNDRFVIFFTIHHIICDEWSLSILMNEIITLYQAFTNDETNPLTPLEYNYKDFTAWQNSYSNDKKNNLQKEYWLNQFKQHPSPLDLPFANSRPKIKTYNGAYLRFEFNERLSAQIVNFNKNGGLTLYMKLVAGVVATLYRYTGQNDIIIGASASGRQHLAFENQIGLFLSTMALRTKVEKGDSFDKLLQKVKEVILNGYINQLYPFDQLVDDLRLKRDLSRMPVFDIMVELQDDHIEVQNNDSKVKTGSFNGYDTNFVASRFDLEFDFYTSNNQLDLGITFNTDLFDQNWIKALWNHFQLILENSLEQPTVPIEQIDYIPADESEELLVKFNNTNTKFPTASKIHQLFEKTAEKYPHKVAINYADVYITYNELNSQANQLAHLLKGKYRLQSGNIVVIAMERSECLLVAILGILKAGAAYLPIDINLPTDRAKYMFTETQATLLLTNINTRDNVIDSFKGEVIDCRELINNKAPVTNNIAPSNTLSDLAYVMYTSGSTGLPKGVKVGHNSVINFLNSMATRPGITDKDKLLAITTYTFDISVLEFLLPLTVGATLKIASDEDVLTPSKIIKQLEQESISIMQATPTFWNAIIHLSWNGKKNLKVLSGGEPISIRLVRDLIQKCGSVWNMYGPTETTIWSSLKRLNARISSVAVGKPIANTKFYILDHNRKLVAKGIDGEICISGSGLSLGYLNRDKETADKFIEHPFIKGEKLYRTGDIGHWLPNGEIKCLGRVDNQVKLRGHRIELEEIENWLSSHNQIEETAVIIKEKNESKFLTAYYVAHKKLETAELREYLVNKLPMYMIPSYYVHMESLPSTANGKLDRKALPDPELTVGDSYIPPSNEVEEKLQEIWAEVLRIDKDIISIDASFFELGGHSLRAMLLANKILKHLEVEIPLKEIFARRDIQNISSFIQASEKSDYAAIGKALSKVNYKVSSAQKRLFFLYALSPKSLSYNTTQIVRLEGAINKKKISEIFNKLIARHESLRTSFKAIGDEPVQKISKRVIFKVEELFASEQEVPQLIQEFIKPFDLNVAPLLRVGLIGVSPSKHILMVDMHHIITDGASIGILIKDFTTLYREEELPILKSQYKDYSQWQHSNKQRAKIDLQKKFWLNEFSDELSVLELPTDRARPSVKSDKGDLFKITFDQEETCQLKRIADSEETTLFMILLSIFNIFLSKLSSQEDIVIGTPTAGRPHADFENVMGMFVNILPLRNYPRAHLSYKEFLSILKTNTLSCFDNQGYQYEELVEELRVERDLSRNPLFDMMFVYQNFEDAELEMPGLTLKPYDSGNITSNFDLSLLATDSEDQIFLQFEYSKELFNHETIEAFAGYLKNIVKKITSDPETKLSDIDILSNKEKDQLLIEFNDTLVAYPKEETIISLFEKQAGKSPTNIALRYGDSTMSYKELKDKADKIAVYLREIKGVKPGDLVGVMMEREMQLIPCVFGVLKAGAAYVPIDPHYPALRINSIIEDSKLRVLITRSEYNNSLLNISDRLVDLNEVEHEIVSKSARQLHLEITGKNLAYVIYTSGSTGKPKGVMIEHHSVINRILWMQKKYPLVSDDVILQKTPIVFDVSVWELFWWSFTGASVCLLKPGMEKEPKEIVEIIKKNKVTTMHFVPSMLSIFLSETDNGFDYSNLGSLRQVFSSGESLKSDYVTLFGKTIHKHCKTRLINLYGPTEATVDVSYHECTFDNEYITVPIGKPIDNIELFILHEATNLQPVGVIGELCISGDGLARGYLHNKILTQERFTENPYRPDERMYRTGDMARWLADGNIEFIGRFDDQVKIRGFRIELGEIEYQLLTNEQIKEATVLAKDKEGEKYLVAYYVSLKALEINDLIAYLSDKLPDYMVPVYYVHMHEFPLTVNGKVNKKSLPDPEVKAGKDYMAPANEMEEKLVMIWAEVLKMEKEVIGVHTSFFDLGGHSLRAMILVNNIFKEFQVEVPIKVIFELKDIRSLCSYIKKSEKSAYLAIEKNTEEKDSYVLSSAQKALYFLHEFNGPSLVYNQPQVMSITGTLDKEKLSQVLKELVRRQEIFRTSFTIINDEPVQVVTDHINFEMGYYQINEQEIKPLVLKLIQPFDLEHSPLFRVDLLEIQPEKYYLIVDTHHIIMDGTSHEILAEQFMVLYNGGELAPLKLQYKDYAEWQHTSEREEKLEIQKTFWVNQFSDGVTRLQLPADFTDSQKTDNEAGSTDFIIDAEETVKLRRIAESDGASMFMIILAVYNVLLAKLSNQEDIVLGTPVAGREHFDTEHMLGMFVASLPLRNYPKNSLSFREFLRQLIANTLDCFENQAYQYEAPIHELNVERSTSHNALYNTFFIFQNFERTEGLEISELNFERYGANGGGVGDERYDFTLIVIEEDKRIHLNLACNNLFKTETREQFINSFKQIVSTIVENLDIKISDIEIITDTEKDRILNDFNNTEKIVNREKLFPQLFREQVEKTPFNIAVQCNDSKLTYQELYRQVRQLSSYLISKGVKANQKVALYMSRGINMLTSIVAVFDAGGAYVPIDVDHPKDRIKDILVDSELEMVLTDNESVLTVEEINNSLSNIKQVLNLDQIDFKDDDGNEISNVSGMDDLAYVIYTSGTSGKPKGVMIHQLGMINHLYAKINDLNLDQKDVIAQSASPCFDISVWQFLAALIIGGTTYIIDKDELLDSERLITALQKNKVTIFESVPSLIIAFLDGLSQDHYHSLLHLRWMIPTGEALPVSLVKKWYSCFPDIKLLNAYGPTEASDDVTHYVVEPPEEGQSAIPIGKPIQNTQIYILDKSLNLCPIGVQGEICVAGLGVGKGYWKNEDKTKQAFVPNLLANELNNLDYATLYKTGDIGYYLEDGNIICLGRVDEQVKIRGFRVELGEIENLLLEKNNVKDAAVGLKEKNGNKYLIAYYVSEIDLEGGELRSYLSDKLPDYMVPSFFVHLHKMPLTSNGKLDKSSLPEPELSTEAQYVAPTSDLEKKLVGIWSDVLKINKESISVVESFFFIGGHSLNSITLISKIHKECDVKISLKEFFANPTVELLAKHVEVHQWLNKETDVEGVNKVEIIV